MNTRLLMNKIALRGSIYALAQEPMRPTSPKATGQSTFGKQQPLSRSHSLYTEYFGSALSYAVSSEFISILYNYLIMDISTLEKH